MKTGQYDVVEIDLGPAPEDTWAERDVRFTDPAGETRSVPAFISGGHWRVRYSSGLPGSHAWASDSDDGEVEVVARTAGGLRLDRGPIRIAENGRTFEHEDGAPFLWLGDTWWHGFVTGKINDQEFADLAAQRNAQGFTVVQIVAGLPCEVQPFDDANRSRAGFAWEPGFAAINTAWWDDADKRVAALVENDLMPCILGSWGYHYSLLTPKQFRRHWREIMARWGAYQVVWCISGEPNLPNYHELAELHHGQSEFMSDPIVEGPITQLVAPRVAAHNAIARYVRDHDPFHRLITTHMIPPQPSWEFLEDESVLDFWMLQTGHSGFNSLAPTHQRLHEALTREPRKPVVNGEVNYEGIADTSYADIQRFLFWSQLLAGAAGFTYGAHGIWAFNTDEFPGQHSGLAPHWKEAAQFAGGGQVGAGRRILDGYPWADARLAPEAVSPHGSPDNPLGPRAIELADGRRLIYVPSPGFQPTFANPTYLNLGEGSWKIDYIDIKTGKVISSDVLHPNEAGEARLYGGMGWAMPSWGDWLVELTPIAE